MGTDDSAHLGGLVKHDRVHRSVYTDAGIYQQEMRRLFGRAWVYIGHDSQVPNPGDYSTTLLGDQSVEIGRAHV